MSMNGRSRTKRTYTKFMCMCEQIHTKYMTFIVHIHLVHITYIHNWQFNAVLSSSALSSIWFSIVFSTAIASLYLFWKQLNPLPIYTFHHPLSSCKFLIRFWCSMIPMKRLVGGVVTRQSHNYPPGRLSYLPTILCLIVFELYWGYTGWWIVN